MITTKPVARVVYSAFFLSLVVIILVQSVMAQGDSDAAAQTKIIALEHAWNLAETNKDSKALSAILEDSMVYVDYDGTLRTKAEFLARLKMPTTHPEQEVTESMTTRVFGSTAVATGIYVAKGVENGKPYLRRGRFIDTWALKNGTWLCVASQATPFTH